MAEENTEQKEFWEGFAAIWVERQADMDALFTPVLQGTLDRAVLAAADLPGLLVRATDSLEQKPVGLVEQTHTIGSELLTSGWCGR